MGRLLIVLLLSIMIPLSAADKDNAKLESEDFLDLARKQLVGNCWMKMHGNLNFRSKDGQRKRFKIDCATQLNSNKIVFKIALDKTQIYKVENVFGAKHKSTVLEDKRGKNSDFEKLGIAPQDLSMAFMYWDYIKELKREVIGAVSCRRFLLADPDSGTFVKVAIAVKYLGPLKVAWYKAGELKADAYQTLSFRDFGKTNKVWHPMEAVIVNAKGEVQVHFSKVEAAHSKVPPKDLYNFGP